MWTVNGWKTADKIVQHICPGKNNCAENSSLHYIQGRLPILSHVSHSVEHMGKALGLNALSNDSIGLCSYFGNSLVFKSTLVPVQSSVALLLYKFISK